MRKFLRVALIGAVAALAEAPAIAEEDETEPQVTPDLQRDLSLLPPSTPCPPRGFNWPHGGEWKQVCVKAAPPPPGSGQRFGPCLQASWRCVQSQDD